jgi:alkanesulfonate monooxygenase SsuD/methylene tetrahydromethanopterin reductase-like flavin-dependent oxidoreductase (luciferase family)
MDIVIGLPNHVARVHGPLILEWAYRAQQRGFAGLGTIDRLVYPSLDSIVSMSLAAGATTDIGLITNVLLAPLYPAALLAKQIGSLAAIAGDRLTLGLGVGNRPDDYTAAGVDFHERGRILDQSVELMRRAWQTDVVAGDRPLCPAPVHIPILFGGASQATVRRVVTAGDGWCAGALRDYANQAVFVERLRSAWQQGGRSGTPRLHASVNYAFGDEGTVQEGHEHLRSYYGFVPEYAALNVADMLTSPKDAKSTMQAYSDLGFDALLFHPAVGRLDQLDHLADAVL